MGSISSRRLFLKKSLYASTGISLLSPALIFSNSIDKTSFAGSDTGLELKSDLRPYPNVNKTLKIEGTIFDRATHKTVKNALVKVRHIAPGSKRHIRKGIIRTDERGRYELVTNFPDGAPDKVPRIYFEVSLNEKISSAELCVNSFGAYISGEQWLKNQQLRNKAFPKLSEHKNCSSIDFNFTV